MAGSVNLYFFAFFAGMVLLAGWLVKPFAGALILALTFAILFKPLYRQIMKQLGQRASLAALFTVTIILIIVIAPLVVVSWQLFQEARQLYDAYLVEQFSGPQEISRLAGQLADYISSFHWASNLDWGELRVKAANWLLAKVTPFFGGVVRTILATIIFFLSLFFFLRDSAYFRERFQDLSPLNQREASLLINQLSQAVTQIVRGAILVAIVQGLLSGLGFFIFGLPQPVIWGLAAALAALVPGVGTALVITPAIIYLYISAGLAPALGLLVWGVMAVGLVDNFLGPILVGRGIRIHPLLILLSVLGGLATFGPVGFIAGPLALAFLFALTPIYRQKID